MPKFGSHIIFAEKARNARPDLFPDVHDAAYLLGAIGPDTTLFMFDPATSMPELRRGMLMALEVLGAVNRVKDEIGRVTDELTKPFDDLTDWLTGGLSNDLRYTINTGIEAMFSAVKLGLALAPNTVTLANPLLSILPKIPAGFLSDESLRAPQWVIKASEPVGFPFRMFGHPFTYDPPWKPEREPPGLYDNWWWMDMLHYRRTGAFATSLLRNARGPVQASYARGYMTHYAGDVSGHPFINSLVDGPFRNHAYRHLVLETMADTWLWSHDGRGDILDAKLHKKIDLNTADSEQVANLVIQTMKEVYTDPMLPKLLRNRYPERDEFLEAYRFMQNYLRMSTSGGVKMPPVPPENPKEILEEIRKLLENNVPGPLPGWNGDIVEFLKALFSWFGKGLTLLAMIATLPYAVLLRFVTVAPRWVIYIINLGLYYIVSAIRTMLCLTGWGYCSEDDFRNFGFLKRMIVSSDAEGRYPMATSLITKPPFYWLASPRLMGSRHELDATVPLMPTGRGKWPSWMIDPNNKVDIAAIHEFANATNPDDAAHLVSRYGGQSVFGNAVDFSIALLDGAVPAFDFDLDGDRGYGFKGWEEVPPGDYYV